MSTDDLAKYEALSMRYEVPANVARKAIAELVEMVREERGATAFNASRLRQWIERAKEAEQELAELKRNLGSRDDWIVSNGHWEAFTRGLK